MKVSASFLSKEYKPEYLIKKINGTDIDYIHVDIMDGKFVENKTWTFSEIKKIMSNTNKKLDIHLMVKNPLKYISDYALLNVEYITFHIEEMKDVDKIIKEIKSYGIKPGIAVNPKTNIKKIFPYLDSIDQVLIMSVEPGKSGQSFMESVLYKIEVLRKEIDEKGYQVLISIDGGINDFTGLIAKEKGVDMMVSASFIHSDVIKNSKILKNL